MYKAVINAHNLREISTEPIPLWHGEAETPSELAEKMTENFCHHSPLLTNGFSITIDISEVKQEVR